MHHATKQRLKRISKPYRTISIPLDKLDYLYFARQARCHDMTVRGLMRRIVAEYILSRINSDEKCCDSKAHTK
jgi:hypothetical protein